MQTVKVQLVKTEASGGFCNVPTILRPHGTCGCTDLWPLKFNQFPIKSKMHVCTKFDQQPWEHILNILRLQDLRSQWLRPLTSKGQSLMRWPTWGFTDLDLSPPICNQFIPESEWVWNPSFFLSYRVSRNDLNGHTDNLRAEPFLPCTAFAEA